MKPLGRIDNKTLYLHDDETYNSQDPHDYMDTIPPIAISVPDFDGDGGEFPPEEGNPPPLPPGDE